jgi:hypothetical protein
LAGDPVESLRGFPEWAIVTSATAPRAKLTQPKVAKGRKLNANQSLTAAFRVIGHQLGIGTLACSFG